MKKLLIRDLMTVGVPTCKQETLVSEIAHYLLDHNVEGMCVLDKEGNGVGVVGTEELVKAYGREAVHNLTAEDVMHEGMPALRADMPLALAAQIMRDQNTRIAFMTHNAGVYHLSCRLHHVPAPCPAFGC